MEQRLGPLDQTASKGGSLMDTILMGGLAITVSRLECSPAPGEDSNRRVYLRIYPRGADFTRLAGTVPVVFPFDGKLYHGSFRMVARVCQRDREESWEFVSAGTVCARAIGNERDESELAVGLAPTKSVAPFFTDAELQDLAMSAHALAQTKRNVAEAHSGTSIASLAARAAERLERLAAKCVRMRSRP
jgi:hypothetical protein